MEILLGDIYVYVVYELEYMCMYVLGCVPPCGGQRKTLGVLLCDSMPNSLETVAHCAGARLATSKPY